MLDAKADILLILVCQGRKLDLYIGHIHALLLSQLSAVDNRTDDVGVLNLHHVHLNQAIVNQDLVAGSHIGIKPAVVDVTDGIISRHFTGGQGIGLAFLQRYLFSVLQLAGADLRSFCIQKRCNRNIQLLAHIL